MLFGFTKDFAITKKMTDSRITAGAGRRKVKYRITFKIMAFILFYEVAFGDHDYARHSSCKHDSALAYRQGSNS